MKITRKFRNHRSQIDLPSALAILIVYFITKKAQMGTTVVDVLAGETPYMPHLHKRNEIGVIISYALISLKSCIPNGTANPLFWHIQRIPYSMKVNSKVLDETEQMRSLA